MEVLLAYSPHACLKAVSLHIIIFIEVEYPFYHMWEAPIAALAQSLRNFVIF